MGGIFVVYWSFVSGISKLITSYSTGEFCQVVSLATKVMSSNIPIELQQPGHLILKLWRQIKLFS